MMEDVMTRGRKEDNEDKQKDKSDKKVEEEHG